ncbi:unnamed protein product [Paramecium octaurelia]|uniref:Uncharacterized protein n=1 Tax=Paramecium octaurelia TaxID=43137 RepID=A0A8S1YN22_PAROT|nr:unnamed protein product [Paramecium octaurelia]
MIEFRAPRYWKAAEQFERRSTKWKVLRRKRLQIYITCLEYQREKEGSFMNTIKIDDNQYQANYKEIIHRCIQKIIEIQQEFSEEKVSKGLQRSQNEGKGYL